jgi:hypothetical protein
LPELPFRVSPAKTEVSSRTAELLECIDPTFHISQDWLEHLTLTDHLSHAETLLGPMLQLGKAGDRLLASPSLWILKMFIIWIQPGQD